MENNLKFNSAICTSRSQSERLLALGLKKETADMMHCLKETAYIKDWFILPLYHGDKRYTVEKVPAWSLHRLIEIAALCPFEIYPRDNIYDLIIDEIEELIKEGYFNKEYLV
jgi:hypothetical protein